MRRARMRPRPIRCGSRTARGGRMGMSATGTCRAMPSRILPAATREEAFASFARLVQNFLPGRDLVASIEEAKEERTAQQRKALFAAAYGPLMEAMGLRGDRDKNELHEMFCGEYWGWRDHGLVRRPVRTTTTDEHGRRDVISIRQQMAFYAFIQQRAAEGGYDVPDPDKEWFRKAEREEELERQSQRIA